MAAPRAVAVFEVEPDGKSLNGRGHGRARCPILNCFKFGCTGCGKDNQTTHSNELTAALPKESQWAERGRNDGVGNDGDSDSHDHSHDQHVKRRRRQPDDDTTTTGGTGYADTHHGDVNDTNTPDVTTDPATTARWNETDASNDTYYIPKNDTSDEVDDGDDGTKRAGSKRGGSDGDDGEHKPDDDDDDDNVECVKCSTMHECNFICCRCGLIVCETCTTYECCTACRQWFCSTCKAPHEAECPPNLTSGKDAQSEGGRGARSSMMKT